MVRWKSNFGMSMKKVRPDREQARVQTYPVNAGKAVECQDFATMAKLGRVLTMSGGVGEP